MVNVKSLVLFAVSAVAVVIPRGGGNDVLGLLKIVDADTRNLTIANKAYNGTSASAVPIEQGVAKLERDLNSTVAATQRSYPFSDAEAQRIIDFINLPLIPDTERAINSTEANRAQIVKNGLKDAVRSAFQELEQSYQRFSQAALSKTSAEKRPALKRATGKLVDLYAGAVKYFS